ncbi:hypothetical protein WA026_013984 [Henosepilachna vigintioctopunctata]|uniref:Uncharacterized protein n=1 Tax=Henosepilachna vigintioctopunctata TaxID=420089 RepID=A0AAW1U7I5_9CUCU
MLPATDKQNSADHRNSIGENVRDRMNKSDSTSISSDVLTKTKTEVISSSNTEKLSDKPEVIYKSKFDWGPKHPAARRMINSNNSSLKKEVETVREGEERKNDKIKMPANDKRLSADHRNSIGEKVKDKMNKSSSTSISADVLTKTKAEVSFQSLSKTEKLSDKPEVIYKPKFDWGSKHPAAGRMINSNNSSLKKELESVREWEERKNDKNKLPANDKRLSAGHRNSIGENVEDKMNKSSTTSISADVLTKTKTEVSASSKTEKLKPEVIYEPKIDWGPKHVAAGRMINSNNSFDEDDLQMVSSYAQQMKEEAISRKIGMREDLEDMKLEEEQKRRKALMKKKLSKKR